MNAEKLVNNFEEYSGLGGQLDEESLKNASEAWLKINGEQKLRTYEPSLGQAEWMSRKCSNITLEQKFLYVVLRKDARGVKKSLSDQEIFAETLFLTEDVVNRETFVNQYPHIFKK